AHQQAAERFTAALFLGLTLYRLGDAAAAVTYLNEAKADPDLRPSATYYAGLALWRQGKTDAARHEFAQSAQERPDLEVARAARYYAPVTEARQPPAPGLAEQRKPWSVYGRLGFEYDTNVVAGPNESEVRNQPGISGEGDGRAVIGAGGAYTLLDADVGS